ncbi:MAG: transposase [Proteobacteria bacterium]|nr:transposase [Pseudomonadota bacterium]
MRERIIELAGERRRFGYRRLHILLRREGLSVNHKAVHRIYREEGLQVRRRKRKRIGPTDRQPIELPGRTNERWSMDFVSDVLSNGRRIRTLNIVDDFSRECPAIEVDTSLTGARVVRVLERLSQTRKLPRAIVVDNVLYSDAKRDFANRSPFTDLRQ